MKQLRWMTALLLGAFVLAACGEMQAAVPESEGQIAVAASHEVDLTAKGSSATVNDALLRETNLEGSTGTGVISSFVRLQTSGSATVEEGYNTSGRPLQFDENSSNQFTRDLPLNAVPVLIIDGVAYREFRLDVNESATEPENLISLDRVRLFASDTPSLDANSSPLPDPDADDFGQGAGTQLIWDLDGDGDVYVKLDYNNSSGSGTGNMVLLVPDSYFPEECAYDAEAGEPCGLWLYLYSEFGVEVAAGAGFEEWAVRRLAALTVEKTAEVDFEPTVITWDIDKSVDTDAWELFQGDAATSNFSITVTPTVEEGYVAVDYLVTIDNVGDLPATVLGYEDELIGEAEVVCGTSYVDGAIGGVVDPIGYLLPAGDSLFCAYTDEVDLEAIEDQTNTFEVSYQTGSDEGTQASASGSVLVELSGLEIFDGFQQVSVADSQVDDPFGPVSAFIEEPAVFTYPVTYTCEDEGDNVNTATIVETDQSDDATVSVACYELAVTKNAETSYDREWTWDITKSAVVEELILQIGEKGTTEYEVTVDAEFEDVRHAVAGSIAVENPAPIAATINGVTDVVSPDIPGTVDCGVAFPYELAAGATLECDYDADLPDAESRTNTATATQQNYAYDGGEPTLNGTTDYSGTADVTFGDPTDEIDESIDVSDTLYGDLGTVLASEAPKTFEYTFDVGPYGECGAYVVDNTASFVTNDTAAQGSDDATIAVTVPCPLEVTKDAATSLTRTWTWTIDKVGDQTEVTLVPGESIDVNYVVEVDATSVDSDWAVDGTISIHNPNTTLAATIEGVSDTVSPDIAATVDCDVTFPYELAAGDTLDCEYDADLPDATARTNTATVETSGDVPGGSGTAEVGFAGAAINEVDEEIDLSDSVYGDLGTVLVSAVPTSVPYTLTVGPFDEEDCGPQQFPNVASFVTNDTGATGSDDHTVLIDVICECDEETAWAAGIPYANSSNWFTYTPYDGVEKTVDLIAGQNEKAGTVHFSAPDSGMVTITIELEDGWYFHDVPENVKIQPYDETPVWGEPSLGSFEYKRDASGDSFSVEVRVSEFYGVHVDVTNGLCFYPE